MEKNLIKTGVLTDERMKPLLRYLNDENIIDVDWNGSDLIVRDINNISTKIPRKEHGITKEYIDSLTQHIANSVSQSFTQDSPILDAETDKYRIQCIHEIAAISGRCIFIRKTTSTPRLKYDKLIKEMYCTEELLNLLINCCFAKFNFIISGEPGIGKTEFGKYLCLFIPDDERVVTIEDTPEWHYKELKPNADGVELQVKGNYTYSKALKTCVRATTSRVMISEVRSVEVKELIELWSSGVKGMTTMHCDDVRKIPDRILNMMPTRLDAERLENNVYENLDIGIVIDQKENKDGVKYRYIEQMCFFERDEGENKTILMVKDGKMINTDIPEVKLQKLSKANITKPYTISEELKERENGNKKA